MRITVDTIKYLKLIKHGENINSYHQRFFLALSALPISSLIDTYTAPDKNSRNNSLSRTWAKVIVGATTGIIVRFGGYKAAKLLANPKANALESGKTIILKHENRFKNLLYPKEMLGKVYKNEDEFEDILKDYHKALGTWLAVAVMAFSNFLVDAPLTNTLTNFLRKNVFKNDNVYEEKEIQNGFEYLNSKVNPRKALEGEAR